MSINSIPTLGTLRQINSASNELAMSNKLASDEFESTNTSLTHEGSSNDLAHSRAVIKVSNKRCDMEIDRLHSLDVDSPEYFEELLKSF